MCRISSVSPSCLSVPLGCWLVTIAVSFAAGAENKKYSNEQRQREQQQREQAKAKKAAADAQEAIKQRQAEIADAQAAKAAADQAAASAQSKLSAAQAANENARHSSEEISKAVAEARKRIAKLETNILGSQSRDSAYGVARKRMEDARAVLDQARERILKDPAYLARYNEAKALPDGAAKLAALRSEALTGDATYVAAERAVQSLVTAFNQLERELLGQNAEWVAATEELKKLLPQLVDTKDALQSSSLKSAAASQTLRNAAAQSGAASASIAQDQAAIRDAQKKLGEAQKKTASKSTKK